jgi:glycerol transport system ATP-binding protein
MARLELQGVAHAYVPGQWALRSLSLEWTDGGAYALLGPSGCGKTTLLNILSGLLRPTEGTVRIDGQDVTALPPQSRNIAQVFQFPVIYDTMTVEANLAFPLRNRKVPVDRIRRRVQEVAELLDLESLLTTRARGLTAEQKQRISLGRGLVREDVSAVLLDEPLTVIDPQAKWHLRRTLREVHQHLGVTLIYVTHDQEEALTVADQVLVMHEGSVLQQGTPQELFEQPAHPFVGHFIGSPGMNLLPAEVAAEGVQVDGVPIPLDSNALPEPGRWTLGIRPEHVAVSGSGVTLPVEDLEHLGTHCMATVRLGSHQLKVRLPEETAPSKELRVTFPAEWVRFYPEEPLP